MFTNSERAASGTTAAQQFLDGEERGARAGDVGGKLAHARGVSLTVRGSVPARIES